MNEDIINSLKLKYLYRIDRDSILIADIHFLELDLELGDLLQEFNDVVKELSAAQASDHVLRNVKRHTGLSDGDDSDYCKYMLNSFNQNI